MTHSVSRSDRLAGTWPPTARWLERLARALGELVGSMAPDRETVESLDMYMSREWLDEFERQSEKRHDAER
jgi:hypothetical protein